MNLTNLNFDESTVVTKFNEASSISNTDLAFLIGALFFVLVCIYAAQNAIFLALKAKQFNDPTVLVWGLAIVAALFVLLTSII